MPSDISLIGMLALSFTAGLTSFFSPCVVAVLPVYIAYLSGSVNNSDKKDSNPKKERKRLIVNTICFVLGIGATFFVLGFAATSIGQALNNSHSLMVRIGGIVIILLGLFQIGAFGNHSVLNHEHRLPLQVEKLAMGPLAAFLLGLFFSFAWTPCVGPVMASLIVVAGVSSTQFIGLLLILVYTLGLALPFVAVALLADRAFAFLRSHRKAISVLAKAGGIVLILIGVLMATGLIENVSNNKLPANVDAPEQSQQFASSAVEGEMAPDFSLEDSEGNMYKLSELKGKTVVLNFWAAWCGYCVQEIPEFESAFKSYGENSEQVVVLSVAEVSENSPEGNADNPETLLSTFKKSGGSYPCLLDKEHEVFPLYRVRSLPTTFIIDANGRVAKKLTGATTKEALFVAVSEAQKAAK